MRDGYDFLGIVIGFGVMGFAVDQYFDTAPLGILGFLVAGLIGAVIRAQSLQNKSEEEKNDKED